MSDSNSDSDSSSIIEQPQYYYLLTGHDPITGKILWTTKEKGITKENPLGILHGSQKLTLSIATDDLGSKPTKCEVALIQPLPKNHAPALYLHTTPHYLRVLFLGDNYRIDDLPPCNQDKCTNVEQSSIELHPGARLQSGKLEILIVEEIRLGGVNVRDGKSGKPVGSDATVNLSYFFYVE
jgi:hypothetical protein